MFDKDAFLTAVLTKAKTKAAMRRVLQLPPSRISEMFSGTRKLTIDEAIALSAAFDVPMFANAPIPATTGTPKVQDVILRLLELEGIPPERAEAIASTADEALQLLRSLPEEGDAKTRARLAAQAVWQMRSTRN